MFSTAVAEITTGHSKAQRSASHIVSFVSGIFQHLPASSQLSVSPQRNFSLLCENMAPIWPCNTLCLVFEPPQTYCTIFHPTVSIVSSHRVHLVQEAAVGWWHTWGDPVPGDILFHREQEGNTITTKKHCQKNVLSLGLVQEKGKTMAASLRKPSSNVQQNSSTSEFNTPVPCLHCFPERGCYPWNTSQVQNTAQATDPLCHLECDRQTSYPWATTWCCTAAQLQPWLVCLLLATVEDSLQKHSQELGWKVLATAYAKCCSMLLSTVFYSKVRSLLKSVRKLLEIVWWLQPYTKKKEQLIHLGIYFRE